MNDLLADEKTNTPKIPEFLKVICILSFVSIGYKAMNTIVSLITGPMSSDDVRKLKVEMAKSINEINNVGGMDWAETILRQAENMVIVLNNHHYANVFSTLAILTIGAIGVWFMWKGRKLGFHLYILYSLIGSAQIFLFMKPNLLLNIMVSWEIAISILFIIFYAMNLKKWINK